MTYHYNLVLVLLSYLVAVLGSFTALQLIGGQASIGPGRTRTTTLFAASVVMGVGAIWAMHFIGMLAFEMPMSVTYDIPLTALSAVVAVIACLIGLSLASRRHHSLLTLATSGSYMGIGVATMHYLGMYAMRMPATTYYDGGIAALSVVVAIVASIAALWIAFQRRGTVQTLLGALVMGVAVCGMHYLGMAAAHFEPDGALVPSDGLGGANLGLIVFGVVFVLLALVLAGVVRMNRQAAPSH